MRLFFAASAAFIVAAALSGWSEASAGQTPPASRAIEIKAEWRLRLENRECTDFCAVNQKDPQDELSRVRVNLSTSPSPNTRLVARLQHSYRRNRINGSADAQEKSGFQQLYFDSRWGNLSLRLGRQEMGFGDYRLLILSNWDNVGFTWDAVRLGVSGNQWQADILYGRPGMFPTNTTHPVLYGVYATYKPSKQWQSDVYLLRKEVIATGTAQRIWAVGARPVVQLDKRTKFAAEAVMQRGEVGSKDLNANAYWARVEYSLPGVKNTRLILQRDFASGGDPNSSTAHTFDQFFGTTFAICSRMGMQGWRNMSAWRIGVSGAPSARLHYTADLHFNRLADSRDYWYGGSGAPVKGASGAALRDPTGAAGTEVGTEFNFTVNYSLSTDLQISAGYGRFMPGRFVRETNSGFADHTDWFYLQTTRRF